MNKPSIRQWTPAESWQWYHEIPVPFGCNFLPSTAVNSTDMWQEESFDRSTIHTELRLASGLGYNSVRVFLPYIVWEVDPAAFKGRVDEFLGMADQEGISVMPVLFDDCAFARVEPFLGEQGDPVPGVHNSRWTPSPGFTITDDSASWAVLEKYVKDIVSTFGDDHRVLIWDLYNEPGNSGRGDKSLPLLKAAFTWAREIGHGQPLTAGSWNYTENTAVDRCCEELSDLVSFHSYESLKQITDRIESLSRYQRPLLCTEWLHRSAGSRIQTHLPMFRANQIGTYNWGLVTGRTQTNLDWNTMTGEPDPHPREWQHDMLYSNGAVYDREEIKAIRVHAGEDLLLQPVDMTPERMQSLEDRGLIIRLRAGGHPLAAKQGQTLGESIYESDERFGPHKLITVTVNREEFAGFATHPDNEEFLLIGDPESNPLYLAVALCMRREFEEKVMNGCLKPEDLVLLRCKYNDPEVSFFVMLKDVPHGEAIIDTGKPPATFYVTESRDLPLDLIEMRKYRLKVDTD